MATKGIPITDPRWRVRSAPTHCPSTPLPMTRHEMDQRGWDACDIVLIAGDAYVDHPSFGAALVGRWLEYLGYRVGIIAQPDPQRIETFRVLGKPRLFWGVTAGNLDSELANLTVMRKPTSTSYLRFLKRFRELCHAAGKPHEIVEYFISGHPGCRLADMVELAEYLHQARVQPEQVQDFYPAPLTMAAAMYYTALDPETSQPIYVARTDHAKVLQRALLLCHKPEFHRKAREALREAGREDLIGRGKHCLVPPGQTE